VVTVETTGQSPQRAVAPTEEEEEQGDSGKIFVNVCDITNRRRLKITPLGPS